MDDTRTQKNSVKKIFESMEYPNDAKGTSHLTEWLKSTGNRIFAYMEKKDEPANGESVALKNINSDEYLCDIYVPDIAMIETILKKVAESTNTWLDISPLQRAKIINKFGIEIQNKVDLFTQLEVAVRGILSKDTKNKSLPLLTDYLQYYSGFSVSYNTNNKSKGLVVAIISDANALWLFGCILGPCLASGNRIILQTDLQLTVVASLLIELSIQVGIPEGTIRLIPGNVDPNVFFIHSDVSTVCIYDDLFKEKYLIANHFGKKLLHFNLSGTSMIICDDCDLDSACYSVVNAAFGCKGVLPWSIKYIFVQENIFDNFLYKLKNIMIQTKVGKSDEMNVSVSYPNNTILEQMIKIVQQAKNQGIEVCQPIADNVFPALFIGNNGFPNNVIKADLINIPIVTVVPFRTINEAVTLANNSRRGLGTSVWTESISLVNEVIEKLKVGNIWVNSHALFAANILVSPYKSSGNAFFGGHEGFYEYADSKSMNIIPSSHLPGNNILEKAMIEAKKGYEVWAKFNQFDRMKALQTTAQNIEANKSSWNLPEQWTEQWISLIYECALNEPRHNFSKHKQFNITTVREPCGIIAIETPINKNDHNKRLIVTALNTGNAVIILNDCEELTTFYSHFAKILPKGVLTVLTNSQDVTKMAALHKELNVYIGDKNSKVFSSLPLKTSSKFKLVNADNWAEVYSKVTLVKNIWMSKGQSFI